LPMLLNPDDFRALHYVGSMGPAAAAIIMTAAVHGRGGLRLFAARLIRWRGCGRWLAFAATLPIGLYAIGVIISSSAGDSVDMGSFLGSKEYGHVGLALVPIEIVCFGFGEEAGWRGFLIPELESSGRTPYRATTLFIAIWATWHLPLFFYAYGLGSMPLPMVPGWLVSIALSSYLITWLFHRARDSILVVAVFHGMVDLVSITPASTAVVLVTVNAGLIAAAILTLTRSTQLFRAHVPETLGTYLVS
ncbi:MAG: CPBP family intramembrane glutamic endopeptidase, partial [Aeromicrobium sp.]